MFNIPHATEAIWNAQKTTLLENGSPLNKVMTSADFSAIEKIWGYPLPEAYKAFISTYGCPVFYDYAPCHFIYKYEHGGMTKYWEGTLNSFCDARTVIM